MMPFQKTQLAFTEYLRKTETSVKTDKQHPRQQQIYRDLVYKNINQCIADTFPITKNIISDNDWHIMIREFICSHHLQTPYFLEICQEFLVYLMHTRKPLLTDHPFMRELAHFEWIQLAIDIADINFPESQNNVTPTENSLWKVSPLVVGLTYSYPVHIIDECYLPTKSSAYPTHLLIYRNRNDDVQIVATDHLSLVIVQLLQAHESINLKQIYQFLSAELDSTQKEIMLARVLPILCAFAENEIVFCE